MSDRDRIARIKAEAALFATAEHLRTVAAELTDYSICTLDPIGTVVTWHTGAEHIHGYAESEVVGRNYSLFFTQEDIDHDVPRLALQQAASKGRLVVEGHRLKKDGSRFFARTILTATRNPAGDLLGFAKISQDISERQNVEVRFAGLLEAAPDAMIISEPNGTILRINVQTEKLFGYSRADLIGQSIDILVPRRLRHQYVTALRRPAMGAGVELRGLRRDGTEFPVEISLSPMHTTDGTVIVSAVRDVTDRVQSLLALAGLERKFRAILESAPEAMVILDRAGCIYLVNAQAEHLFGYDRGALIGQPVEVLMPVRYRHRHDRHRLDYFSSPRSRIMGGGMELQGMRSTGEEFPVEIMLSPLENADEILVTAVIRDVSERRRAEDYLLKTVQELRRANEELQQFAYLASHDLQEPLRMVASYTQLLANRYKGRLDADADEFIQFAVDGATRMQRLIQDLLAYCREGESGIGISPDVSSEHALQTALTNLQQTTESSGAIITSGGLPTLPTNELQLVRVFQNLIGNAIKYRTEVVPTIHVSSSAGEDRTWHFEVRDNGIGIEPRHFEKIFVLFQRLHGQKEYEGTGMGLAICKKTVERLGGRIWVTSAPGSGSTFHFLLPMVNAA